MTADRVGFFKYMVKVFAARKEDTSKIFDEAFDHVRWMIFYLSPLVDTWKVPRHHYLDE